MPSLALDLEVLPLTLADGARLSSFDCGDADLNEFVQEDALRLQEERVAQTYLARRASSGERILGYVSLLSDAIRLQTKERKQLRLQREDHPIVPALKIARLAVCEDMRRGSEIGIALISFSFMTGLELSSVAGCRLLTLDAYPDALDFYQRLGFRMSRDKEYRD